MKSLLRDVLTEMTFARVFITSGQKMHPCGVDLYDDLIERVKAALDGPSDGEIYAAVSRRDMTPEEEGLIQKALLAGGRSIEETILAEGNPAMTSREELLAKAAQDFIDKVDRGAARSEQSYAAFKAALSAPAQRAPDRDAVAQAIYETEPFYEGGEYVDGFQVSPGGNLSWKQACDRDAEFADDKIMLPITKFAYDAADRVLALSAFTSTPAQRPPMAADIAQIIQDGWYAGRSSVEVTEEILREFDTSPVTSTPAEPAQRARDAVIEECARVCESGEWVGYANQHSPTKSCAMAIRDLKGSTVTSTDGGRT
jgi:hypothetical protein